MKKLSLKSTTSAETIQDELKRNLNNHANLVNQEWKVYLSTLHQDPPQVFRNSWGADYPDPETFMNLFTSYNGNNDTCWKNPTYDNLIAQAEGDEKRLGGRSPLCLIEMPVFMHRGHPKRSQADNGGDLASPAMAVSHRQVKESAASRYDWRRSAE